MVNACYMWIILKENICADMEVGEALHSSICNAKCIFEIL